MSDQSDFLEIEPWPVAELAGHLVAQVTLGRRSLVEMDTEAEAFERETDRFELEAWARLELGAWLTAAELDQLGIPVGKLPENVVSNFERGMVIASTIAWALYVVKEPFLPVESDGSPELRTLEWAPTPWTPVRQVVKGLKTRTEEHLAAERERWEIIHWRTTLFNDPDLVEEDRSFLAEIIAELGDSSPAKVSASDLLLDDSREFSDLNEDELEAIRGDAEVRLRTLNWICGYGESPTSAPLHLDDGDE